MVPARPFHSCLFVGVCTDTDRRARLRDARTQNLDYNVPGGKLNRGISVVDSVEILKGRKLNDDEYFRAALLGWCVEFVSRSSSFRSCAPHRLLDRSFCHRDTNTFSLAPPPYSRKD